ncbi:MAG: L,D-transpeptidase family protein [Firmicutes bacterium]|nr:L,D-transpeptidase family protein [Bacillota bacterium]
MRQTVCALVLCISMVAACNLSAAIDPLQLPVPLAACDVERVLTLTSPFVQGPDVIELQESLRALGLYDGAIDGVYGPRTQEAVQEFQRLVRLPPDGVVDAEVWALLLTAEEPSLLETARTPKPEGDIHIEVDTRTLRLTVYVDGKPYKSYPVAVGRPTRFTLSPVGEWKIVHKGVNWGGGFGTRWLGLNVPWGIYGIHGTNKPSSIGTRASAGCIRMQNRDVEELFEWVSIGTPVRILGDPPSHLEFSRHLRAPLSGSDVVFVQLQLHHLGFDPQGADGRFGENTARAVRELQEAFGLPVDGTVYDDVYYILGLR